MQQQIIAPFIAVSLFCLLFLGLLKAFGPLPIAISSTTTMKTDAFSVSGEGESSMRPDIAQISIGVAVSGSTVKQAQDQINTIINRTSEAVKNLGIDAKDIQTTNYNIHPNYDYRDGGQRILGYRASTNLSVKVRDISKVNSVIDQATANGANQVSSITFDVADREKAENEAREKAVAAAKKKAQEAANAAGFRLGKLVNYSENFGGGTPVPVRMDLQAAPTTEKTVPTQVEPGSQEIQVTVNLSYEIR